MTSWMSQSWKVLKMYAFAGAGGVTSRQRLNPAWPLFQSVVPNQTSVNARKGGERGSHLRNFPRLGIREACYYCLSGCLPRRDLDHETRTICGVGRHLYCNLANFPHLHLLSAMGLRRLRPFTVLNFALRGHWILAPGEGAVESG